MCGIVGIWNGNSKGNFELLKSMSAMLRHRGPDDQGYWVDENKGVALAHTRLSVIDVTSTGAQPMIKYNGKHVLVFNGEIYNYQEIRRELESSYVNINWAGNSDTEVLLESLVRFGLDKTLARIRGMFAFAYWNADKETVTLARDAAGEKPLYYGEIGEYLFFSSELRVISRIPGRSAEISKAAVFEFLERGYISAPHTIFSEVKKLLPGSYVTLSKGRVGAPILYWHLSAQINDIYKDEIGNPKTKFHNLFCESVAEQMISDVPLGAFLSAGYDSCAVVAAMREVSDRSIKTYTIGFENPNYDESEYAKKISKILGTHHTEYKMTGNAFVEAAGQLGAVWDEPFADASALPTLALCKMAREDVTVALSGDGGDELFFGYSHYSRVSRHWRLLRKFPGSGKIGKLQKYFSRGEKVTNFDYLNEQLRVGSKFGKLISLLNHSNDISNFYRVSASHFLLLKDASCLISEEASSDGEIISKLAMVDFEKYLPDDILVKLDRASMSASLETRAPFLSKKVMEFSVNLSIDYKIKNGQGKCIVKDFVHEYVSSEIMNRPKKGFGIPLGQLLNTTLGPWVIDNLNFPHRVVDELVNVDLFRRIYLQHRVRESGFEQTIWNYCALNSWANHNLN